LFLAVPHHAGAPAFFFSLFVYSSRQVLTARLLARGREAHPGEVASRVARATAANPRGDHVIAINNVGRVASGVAACVAALRGRLRYALWLVGQAAQRPAAAMREARQLNPSEPHTHRRNVLHFYASFAT
jgi:hypothetical protein